MSIFFYTKIIIKLYFYKTDFFNRLKNCVGNTFRSSTGIYLCLFFFTVQRLSQKKTQEDFLIITCYFLNRSRLFSDGGFSFFFLNFFLVWDRSSQRKSWKIKKTSRQSFGSFGFHLFIQSGIKRLLELQWSYYLWLTQLWRLEIVCSIWRFEPLLMQGEVKIREFLNFEIAYVLS